MSYGRSTRRVLVLIGGGAVLALGVALLVLPGPGLLLVLAGLLILAREFPAVDRYVEPVRERAIGAAEESVTSWWRLTGAILTGLALIAAGVAWGIVDELPFSGWSAASGLVLSGLILFALLYWSFLRVKGRR